MSKTKQTIKKQESKVKVQKSQGPQSVAEVFSLARDIEVLHPYHMDGDIEMYSKQNIEERQSLRKDPEIIKQLTEITKMYNWQQTEGVGKTINGKQYKSKQRMLAIILRPDIDKQQLQFIIESDWQHDRIKIEQQEYMTKEKLIESLWELVDVWTIGVTRQEYLSFCRLLKKKLDRSIKTQK